MRKITEMEKNHALIANVLRQLCLLWEQEVVSSNLAAPTLLYLSLRINPRSHDILLVLHGKGTSLRRHARV